MVGWWGEGMDMFICDPVRACFACSRIRLLASMPAPLEDHDLALHRSCTHFRNPEVRTVPTAVRHKQKRRTCALQKGVHVNVSDHVFSLFILFQSALQTTCDQLFTSKLHRHDRIIDHLFMVHNGFGPIRIGQDGQG